MTTRDILIRARGVIEHRAHWTTGYAARDRNGRAVRSGAPNAVRWCALGALQVANSGVRSGEAIAALATVIGGPVSAANDAAIKYGGLGHRGILAAFDAAIASCA